MTERWDWIEDYVGLYQISDKGRVKSYRRDKILSPAKTRGGSLLVCLSKNGKTRSHRIHRLVLQTFVGGCPKGHEGRHKNGVMTDNDVRNLFWERQGQKTLETETRRNANKTHCPRNHEYTGDNLRFSSKGQRLCVACRKDNYRLSQQRKKCLKMD